MPKKGFGKGSKLYQQRAKAALPFLVSHAGAWHTVTYGQFARELGMQNHRNLNHVLGAIGSELEALGKKWGEEIPAINCIVVNKGDQTPRRGIEFHMPIAEFKKLPKHVQKQELQKLHRKIYVYPKWERVLKHFGMASAPPTTSNQINTLAAKAGYGKGGGETEDHRLLKEHLAKHPKLLKLPATAFAAIEFTFASADKIDILFKCPSEWVGVEVKGINSDAVDIMRGIYQCVKYQALIEATQKREGKPLSSRVILALGGDLPSILEHVVGLLDIDVRRNIPVPGRFQTKSAAAGN